MRDCIVHVPAFLVLSNQVVMDSGETPHVPDEGAASPE